MKQRNNSRSREIKRGKNKSPFLGIIMCMAAYSVIYIILAYISIAPKANISEGEIASETIKATRDVVDEYSTSILKQSARDNVSESYIQDDSITTQVLNDLENCFVKIDQVRDMGVKERERLEANKKEGEAIKFTESFFADCAEVLPDNFRTSDIISILNIEEEEYRRLYDTITQSMTDAMESGIRESIINTRITDLNQKLILNDYSDSAKLVGSTIISMYIQANLIYDAITTENARNAAQENIEDVIYREGEIIISDGVSVTKPQVEVLKSLGLLKEEGTGWVEYIALSVILLLLFIIGTAYIIIFEREMIKSNKKISAVLMAIILTVIITWACTELHPYIIPIAYTPLVMVLIMLDKRSAIFINAILSIIIGIMGLRFGEGTVIPVIIASFLGGSISVFVLRKAPQRATLMVSGIIAGLIMSCVYIMFDLLNYVPWLDMLLHGGMGIASGLLTSILAIGTLPMWESMFKLITPMKLLELTNPNQPLLKKLLVEAPGTYHHSIIVGNMAERGAEAIGANPLIVRVGAYYHDIGKTKRPYFFVENFSGSDNPHDEIEAETSARTIMAHVSDGLEMARRAKLPKVIADIIGQHHGDTAVSYFYLKKRKNSANPDDVNKDDFRYPQMRPHSKEAVIVMLADSCEAAVRSITHPNEENVKTMIDTVIKGKLDDGQLNYSNITMAELNILSTQFVTALKGLFHERIEYPEK